jgi:hypothetical protein
MAQQRDASGRFAKRGYVKPCPIEERVGALAELRRAEERQIQRWADGEIPTKPPENLDLTPTDLLFGAVCIILLSLAAAVICAALP